MERLARAIKAALLVPDNLTVEDVGGMATDLAREYARLTPRTEAE